MAIQGQTIDTKNIADDAVTTAKIKDINVTTAKVADDNITAAKMFDLGRGSILYGNASAVTTELTKGGASEVLKSDGTDIAWAAEAGGGGNTVYNAIINGDMTIAQRGTAFRAGDNDDDSYTLDRWIVLSDGNDIVDVTQTSDTAVGDSKYAIQLDVETVDKKFGIVQIIENVNCHEMIGDNVSLSFRAKVAGSGKLDNVKAGVVAWSGTADSVTSDIISAWGAEDTNPTLIANATFENTPANLNVTTSYATYKIENISIDTASTNNILVFIWSDVVDTDLTDSVYITDVQLEKGTATTTFVRELESKNLSNCQRYYFAPSGNAVGIAYSTKGMVFNISFPMVMRSSPSATIEYGGVANKLYRIQTGGTQIITLTYFGNASGTTHLYDLSIGAWTGGTGEAWNTQFTYNSEL